MGSGVQRSGFLGFMSVSRCIRRIACIVLMREAYLMPENYDLDFLDMYVGTPYVSCKKST